MNYNERQNLVQFLQIASLALGIAVAVKSLEQD